MLFNFKKKIVIGCFFIVGIFFLMVQSRKETINWHLSGYVFEDVSPSIGGDLRKKGDDFYIFDQSSDPMTSNLPYDPPETVEEAMKFIPQPTEPWMNDVNEIKNRATVRLGKGRVNSGQKIIFEERGQKSFWWASSDMNTIYIVSFWFDSHLVKELLEKPIGYLSLWVSRDAGDSFTKQTWSNPLFERASRLRGMEFDRSGQYGYVFVDDYIVQTKDYGHSWQKIVLPMDISLPIKDSHNIQALTVDHLGNLWFVMGIGYDSHLFKISSMFEESDHSQDISAVLVVKGRHFLNLKVNDQTNDIYGFLVTSNEFTENSWRHYASQYQTDLQDESDISQLSFMRLLDGEIQLDNILDLQLTTKDVYSDVPIHTNKYGQPIVNFQLNRPMRKSFTALEKRLLLNLYVQGLRIRFILISNDNGANWDIQRSKISGYASDYLEKNGRYWRYDGFKRLFYTEDIFSVEN